MNIFEVFISVFISLIEFLFLQSYNITGNYGVSLLMLSFCISLLLLPIFIVIEKSKKKDDIIKRKMQPVLDEIKRCYKGQERYYYIKTLNRQNGYSPLKAIIPILSLLVQIPFFIAAYQYIENFEPLSGVSFLFIKDLSLPDGVMGKINVLPILMTLINIITAYLYTRNGNTKERKQMLIIALAFLILLFNLPSGLVLYWTMNNFFSFLRLFITNPEVFQKKEIKSPNIGHIIISIKDSTILLFTKYLRWYVLFLLVSIGSQFNWAFSNDDFNDINARVIGAAIISYIISLIAIHIPNFINQSKIVLSKLNLKHNLFFILLFVSQYFYFAGKYYYQEPNKTFILLALVSIIALQLYGLTYLLQFRNKIKNGKTTLYSFFLLSICFLQLLHAYSLIVSEEISIFAISNNSTELSNIILLGIIFSYSIIPAVFSINNLKLSSEQKNSKSIYILSIVYICGYVFLWNPLIVFSTFPESFNFFAIDIITNNISLFFVSILSLTALYFFIPKKTRWILSVTTLSITLIWFAHNTLYPIQVGVINETVFEQQQKLALPFSNYFIECITIILIVLLSLRIVKLKRRRYGLIGLALLNIVIISEGLYESGKSGKFSRDNNNFLNTNNSISFSKTENNVVFIIPDAVQGWALQKMLDENKNLEKELDGFTWFPNTLAVSRVTNTSMGGILGGHEFDPCILNKNNSTKNGLKISQAKQKIAKQAHENNYNFTSTKIAYCDIDKKLYDTYLPSWNKEWDIFSNDLGFGSKVESGFSFLWNNALFFSAPYVLKARIYNQGKWINPNKNKKNINNNESQKHNFIRLLPYISNTNTTKGNFIITYTLTTHHPWHHMQDDGILKRNVSPYENNLWLINSMIKWTDWMKKNDVYDNTRIVIVSDHGPHWKQYKGEIDVEFPFKNTNKEKIESCYLRNANPLLLFKDFNSSGNIKYRQSLYEQYGC